MEKKQNLYKKFINKYEKLNEKTRENREEILDEEELNSIYQINDLYDEVNSERREKLDSYNKKAKMLRNKIKDLNKKMEKNPKNIDDLQLKIEENKKKIEEIKKLRNKVYRDYKSYRVKVDLPVKKAKNAKKNVEKINEKISYEKDTTVKKKENKIVKPMEARPEENKKNFESQEEEHLDFIKSNFIPEENETEKLDKGIENIKNTLLKNNLNLENNNDESKKSNEIKIIIGRHGKIRYNGRTYRIRSKYLKKAFKWDKKEKSHEAYKHIEIFDNNIGFANLSMAEDDNCDSLVLSTIINSDLGKVKKNNLVVMYMNKLEEKIKGTENSKNKELKIEYNLDDLSKSSFLKRIFRREMNEKQKAMLIERAKKASESGLATIKGTYVKPQIGGIFSIFRKNNENKEENKRIVDYKKKRIDFLNDNKVDMKPKAKKCESKKVLVDLEQSK